MPKKNKEVSPAPVSVDEITDNLANISFTAAAKTLFASPAKTLYSALASKKQLDFPEFSSVYEMARKDNVTVEAWVQQDPERAIRVAEGQCAAWQNILTTAAMQGTVSLRDPDTGELGEYTVTKNQAKLLEVRVKEAQSQLNYVTELALCAYENGDKKRDALLKTMYRRALRGNDRLAIYLIDRQEGRPAETKQVELDMDNARNVYYVIKTLFDKQLEVLNSGNGTKLVCCSRRSGKTHLLVAILLIECMRRPRTKVMYIGETMDLSEGLIDKAVNDIIDACDLRDARGRRFNWRKMDNGSEIMVRGLSNTKDPDLIRGAAAKVIVIDEFFHLKSELLEYMQREVLEPMQMDFADDYMFICAGTPPQVKGTYGEHVWKTWDVPHFSWTWRDNPHPVDIKKRKEYVDKVLADKGLDWSSSFARREYNGEWAYDEDLLLYPSYHTYDPNDAVPSVLPSRVLFGIDYGVGDNDTLWGCVWNDDERRGYQFWEAKFNRLDLIDKNVSQLDYLCDQVRRAWSAALSFFPHLHPREANKRILWDADDNDQHITDHMNAHVRHRYVDPDGKGEKELTLNIGNAHKTDKAVMFDRIGDLLRTGDLLIMRGGKCEHELESTILKRGPNGEVYREVDLDAYHPDLLPAMRYALWNVVGAGL